VILSLIVAMDQKSGIGKNGGIPWHLGADLKTFKNLTMGHHLLLGRRTYESIGRALPGRTTIVLTSKNDYLAPGCLISGSLDEGLALAERRGEEELFVGGGGEVFKQTISLAQKIYLTIVHTTEDCDVFFPEIDWQTWGELERGYHPADDKNDFAFEFRRLVRLDQQAIQPTNEKSP
jgi:dihydrofolate reductase